MLFPTYGAGAAPATTTDPVGLSWLVTVRWTTVLAGAARDSSPASGRLARQRRSGGRSRYSRPCVLSNLWLMWRIPTRPQRTLAMSAGSLVCADVMALTWLLWRSGGVLNPASVYYLVQIVVAALVLGRVWTWTITALSVTGYATLFAAQPDELSAAQVMHPEIGLHMQGMWLAFALTALVIGILVVRLATAVERRDRALVALSERTSRATRVAGLATLAAGAAHELSTPLATIAVASRELEKSLSEGNARADWQRDAALIRHETGRCRDILDAMAGESGDVAGEAPRSAPLSDVVVDACARLGPRDRERVIVRIDTDAMVLWPVRVVGRALGNVLQNAVHASEETTPVSLDVRAEERGGADRRDGSRRPACQLPRSAVPASRSSRRRSRALGRGLASSSRSRRSSNSAAVSRSSRRPARGPQRPSSCPSMSCGERPHMLDGVSLLIVEDDELFGERLSRACTARGLEVRVARTAAEAQALSREDPPELVLLDLRIGQDSGLALVPMFKAMDPETRIVVLTGYGSVATAVQAVRQGALDYLTKPADVDEILAAFEGRTRGVERRRANGAAHVARSGGVGTREPCARGLRRQHLGSCAPARFASADAPAQVGEVPGKALAGWNRKHRSSPCESMAQ